MSGVIHSRGFMRGDCCSCMLGTFKVRVLSLRGGVSVWIPTFRLEVVERWCVRETSLFCCCCWLYSLVRDVKLKEWFDSGPFQSSGSSFFSHIEYILCVKVALEMFLCQPENDGDWGFLCADWWCASEPL